VVVGQDLQVGRFFLFRRWVLPTLGGWVGVGRTPPHPRGSKGARPRRSLGTTSGHWSPRDVNASPVCLPDPHVVVMAVVVMAVEVTIWLGKDWIQWPDFCSIFFVQNLGTLINSTTISSIIKHHSINSSTKSAILQTLANLKVILGCEAYHSMRIYTHRIGIDTNRHKNPRRFHKAVKCEG